MIPFSAISLMELICSRGGGFWGLKYLTLSRCMHSLPIAMAINSLQLATSQSSVCLLNDLHMWIMVRGPDLSWAVTKIPLSSSTRNIGSVTFWCLSNPCFLKVAEVEKNACWTLKGFVFLFGWVWWIVFHMCRFWRKGGQIHYRVYVVSSLLKYSACHFNTL